MVIRDFKIGLPGDGWENAKIDPYSVWGNGNQGRDHWGWPHMAWMDVGSVFKEGNQFFFKIFLVFDDVKSNHLAFICRITRANGTAEVFCQDIRI